MPEADQDRIRTLVVDDDPVALTVLAKHLRSTGHEVFTAHDGTEALKILSAYGPPMVITDWLMPEMNGLELCQAIRTHEGIPFAYVIITTARDVEEGLVKAFDAGRMITSPSRSIAGN